ncbi:hypothetical protein J2Z48_002930 [Croceifilum oryzae]|uniref:Uncharacterized protein n=1 Tax=Croceifilum oryzae TaxID=1553429 RepID=A0AAJ1TQM7_9BACL|nr:hypothetical protein [Croceifilum oryzae]
MYHSDEMTKKRTGWNSGKEAENRVESENRVRNNL